MSEFETTLTEQTYHPPVSRYRFPALGSTVTETLKEVAMVAVGAAVCVALSLGVANALGLAALFKAAAMLAVLVMAALYAISPAVFKAVVMAVYYGARLLGGLLVGEHWAWAVVGLIYVAESEWRRYKQQPATTQDHVAVVRRGGAKSAEDDELEAEMEAVKRHSNAMARQALGEDMERFYRSGEAPEEGRTLEGFVRETESSVKNGSRTLEGFMADNEDYVRIWEEVLAEVAGGQASRAATAEEAASAELAAPTEKEAPGEEAAPTEAAASAEGAAGTEKEAAAAGADAAAREAPR